MRNLKTMSDSNDLATLLSLEDSLGFVPKPAMIKTKAKLLALIADNPMFVLDDLSLSAAVEFTKERRLREWWKIEGFEDWFKNRAEFKAEVEDLLMLSIKRLRTILNSDSERMANAQISAAKLLFEAADKLPKNKQGGKFSDDAISKMNSEQLEEFLKKAGYQKIAPPKEPIFLTVGEEDVEERLLSEEEQKGY
jgi:hypothetical protein